MKSKQLLSNTYILVYALYIKPYAEEIVSVLLKMLYFIRNL